MLLFYFADKMANNLLSNFTLSIELNMESDN